MTLSRNQLGGVVAGMVCLVGIGVYVGRGSRPADTTQVVIQSAPRLPTGKVTGLPPQIQQNVEFMTRGGLIFVFLHEAGHMAIHELTIPSTGPEEDVADEFATFVLTDTIKAAPENQKDLFANIVFAGAVYWRLMGQQREKGGGNIAWFDEHSPDLRRYYGILCLASGADPLRFIPMAVRDGVPENRLRRCAEEYKTKHVAWDTLMAPHAPGFLRRAIGGHRLILQTGPAVKNEWLGFENIYKQGGFFQQMLDGMSSAVDLPRDIPVIVKGCGVVNAFYEPDAHTITLCHDFAENLAETFAMAAVADMQAQQAQQQGGGGGGNPPQGPPQGTPPQTPPPQGTPPPPQGNPPENVPPPRTPQVGQAALAGNWACQVNTPNGPVNEQLSLRPDSSFQVEFQTPNGLMRGWGRWSVQGTSLRFDYEGPPGVPSPEIIPFQMPQPNMLQTRIGTCTRVGLP